MTEIQFTTARKYLRWDISVVVDDTNLRLKVAKDWADVAVECGAEFEVWDFTDVSMEECIRRDTARAAEMTSGRSVGEAVITNMYNKFLKGRGLEPVEARAKGVDETRQYVPDHKLPTAWIFDIDGTLAQLGQRSPYDFQKVWMDSVDETVRQCLWAHQIVGDKIVIVSGRDEACRGVTEKWLADNDIEYDAFFMRPEGDVRKDTIVKAEILWNQVAPCYAVLGCYDDRNSVVAMWRAVGLKTMQCQLGDF